jgi:hypothetical protein
MIEDLIEVAASRTDQFAPDNQCRDQHICVTDTSYREIGATKPEVFVLLCHGQAIAVVIHRSVVGTRDEYPIVEILGDLL